MALERKAEKLWEQYQADTLPKEEINITAENTLINPVERLALKARAQEELDNLPVEEGSSPLGAVSAMEEMEISPVKPEGINPPARDFQRFQDLLQQVQEFIEKNRRWPRIEIHDKTEYTEEDAAEVRLASALFSALVRDPKNIQELKALEGKYGLPGTPPLRTLRIGIGKSFGPIFNSLSLPPEP